jgi:hypothetical protein
MACVHVRRLIHDLLQLVSFFVPSVHKGAVPRVALLAVPLYFLKVKQLPPYDTTGCAATRRMLALLSHSSFCLYKTKVASLRNNSLRGTLCAFANLT